MKDAETAAAAAAAAVAPAKGKPSPLAVVDNIDVLLRRWHAYQH